MKIHKILTLILLVSLIIAQDTWVKTYQPFGDGDYYVEDVLVSSDSGYAVNGYYYCYDPDPGGGCDDYWGFLMKTDSDGNLEWIKMDTVSWIGESESGAFVQTNDGGFISAVFSLWGGTALIKRDSLGNREWVVDNGGIENGLYIHSMDMTMDGNVILGGRMNGQATFRKITQTGETLWTHSYFPQSGSIQSIIQTSDGGYAGTGYINRTTLDILVIKTDENGDSLWTRTFDGNNDSDHGFCVIESFNHNILVGSAFSNPSRGFLIQLNMYGDTLSAQEFYNTNFIHAFIQSFDNNLVIIGSELFKINLTGEIIWQEQFIPWGHSLGGDRTIRETSKNIVYIGREYWGESITIVKTDSNGQVLSILGDPLQFPQVYNLSAYPNPFNPKTKISIDIPVSGRTGIHIYNIAGQKVRTLKNEYLEKGKYTIVWDGKDSNNNQVSSGIYFVNLIINNQVLKTSKVTLIK